MKQLNLTTIEEIELIRDNGVNKTDNKKYLPIVDRFQSLVQFFKKDSKTNQSIKDKDDVVQILDYNILKTIRKKV